MLSHLEDFKVPVDAKHLVLPLRYALLDLDTADSVPLADIFEAGDVSLAWAAAFAPDGRNLVLTVPGSTNGTVLRAYDAGGTPLWDRDLGAERHLAGSGAYTPDGRAIAIITLDGCTDVCDRDQLAARRWTVSYVDAATGADVAGPPLPAAPGMAMRALGWHGTDLVVVQSRPEDGLAKDDEYFTETGWYETGDVRVLALRSDDTVSVLLDPPNDVTSIDIPQDLIRDGTFAGPTSSPSLLPVRWGVLMQVSLCTAVPLLLIAAGAVVVVRRVLWRRRVSG
ncbi:hypothetical protein ACFFX1_34035 [Dactylosporangium sucinum]|uniref:WD40 repeat domain-containing protein n=1 Tax=Dactylosporangium sucinum TaxID=1424081 RepID=A0A917X8Q2_9ACTN|nr:hypothetical protein [Dactylosporangium sucinum]GGM88829.1 hypothetical protein GCM10007977_108560 [Dactylosporangium sucinum]